MRSSRLPNGYFGSIDEYADITIWSVPGEMGVRIFLESGTGETEGHREPAPGEPALGGPPVTSDTSMETEHPVTSFCDRIPDEFDAYRRAGAYG